MDAPLGLGWAIIEGCNRVRVVSVVVNGDDFEVVTEEEEEKKKGAARFGAGGCAPGSSSVFASMWARFLELGGKMISKEGGEWGSEEDDGNNDNGEALDRAEAGAKREEGCSLDAAPT